MEKVERDAYVNSAIESGIGAEAVRNSISGVIKKSEEVGFVPKQFNKILNGKLRLLHQKNMIIVCLLP